MGKHQDQFLYRYWEENWKKKGGTLIPEFPVVRKTNKQETRLIDGVIVLNGQERCLDGPFWRRPHP